MEAGGLGFRGHPFGWSNGSGFRNNCCSYRGPEFVSSTYMRRLKTTCNFSSSEHPLLASVGTHAHMTFTLIHIYNKIKGYSRLHSEIEVSLGYEILSHTHTHKKIKNNLDFKLKLEGFTLILDYIGKKNELLNQKTNS